MILPITLTIAAAAALLHMWLATRVSRLRLRHGISVGDGGNPALARRMRAHANFAESTPIFLILLGLIEHGIGSALWLWAAAILFVLARILHAFGMDQPPPARLRMIGIVATMLVLAGLAGYAVFLSYSDGSSRRPIEAPAMHRADSGR